MKPVLFVTGHAPQYRVGAFARLHEREGIELALFGGRSRHGGASHSGELPFPSRQVRPRELAALAMSGDYRAVVCPTGGRLAPLASWLGARRGGLPLILWASLWAHPRSAAHALSYLPLRRLYRSADAVVTYGPHVSAYVRARGARNIHVAAQSVDDDFWRSPEVSPPPYAEWPSAAQTRFLMAGRAAPEKGIRELLGAWRASRLAGAGGALVLVGPGGDASASGVGESVISLGAVGPSELRDIYAACEVLVVPSITTRTFREPWGLVVNEAMARGLAVIASDAVGAAAGGLVRDGANGLIVPAGDREALRAALVRLAGDGELRERMGAQGSSDVRAFSHDAWATGFSRALSTLGLSRSPAPSPEGVASVD
jgi:glycosyltransferase involved in cell wall biosynthesis